MLAAETGKCSRRRSAAQLMRVPMNLFSFPDDARWDGVAGAVEFGIAIGEYRGVVRVPRYVFLSLLAERPTPEHCIEAYHLHRSQFERAAEAKLRAHALSADGNLDLTLGDLRLRSTPSRTGGIR